MYTSELNDASLPLVSLKLSGKIFPKSFKECRQEFQEGLASRQLLSFSVLIC